jgi:prepilin-type N-terminal cleavage/methylation domain-containing protein
MLKRYFRSESGVTLIEVLVAIVILATVGATMVAGVFTVLKGDESVRRHIAADSLARYEIEYVKAMTYLNAPWSYILPGTPPSWDVTHTSLPSGYTDYTVTVQASILAGYDNDIQMISAVVSYKGSQVLQVDTYRTK